LIGVLLLLLPTLVLAQGDLEGVAAMARYFPANTVVFTAVRTDEAFLDQLDSLLQPAFQMAEATGTSATSLREALNMGLANANTDLDTLMAWLGDYAATGATPQGLQSTGSTPAQGFYIAVEVADRAGAEAFLESALPSGYASTQEDDFTLFTNDASGAPNVAVSDDLLLVYPAGEALPTLTREARLDSSSDFQTAIGALPAGNYSLLIYSDASAMAQGVPLDPGGNLTFDTAPLAVGFTILDGRTFTIDSAQLPLEGAAVSAPTAIDPDFARFIPGNSSVVIHATDLTTLYDTTIDFADRMNSGSAGSPAPSAQVTQVFAMMGIDLQADLLDWTTGDYALFFRTNILDVISSAVTSGTPDLQGLESRIDLGLVIEATDPDKARAFAVRLDTLIGQMVTGQQGVSVSSETIGGVEVTVLSLSAPVDPRTTITIDLLLGVTDDVFFFATRPAAETIISGDGMLTGNRSFAEAQGYLLPNPTTVVYADGEGLLLGTGLGAIVPLALMGPSIGNVFDDIVTELQAEGGVRATPTPLPTATPTPTVDPAMIMAQLEASINSISSSSFSAAVTEEGITLLRFVVTGAE
jgi:hypothetical protein